MNLDLIIEAIRQDTNVNSLNNLKFPCSICNKNVLNNQKAIQCDSCDLWCHIKCNGTCLLCKVKANHKNFPFTLCDDIEIQNINNSNSLRFCEFLSRFEVVSEVSKFSNITCNEIDYNLPVRTTCKYYSANEFLNLKTSLRKSFQQEMFS